MTQRFPHLLLVFYLILFTLLAIHPYDRAVWFAENLPIMLIVTALVFSKRWFTFSNTAYLMMACLIVLHTIGGHFTFERVPFGWVTDFFGFSRNHYDRMAHFTVGFYAYPLAELLLRKRLVVSRFVLIMFPICFILAVAGVYEIFEWRYAVSADPTAGAAVLGSQGDVWDAQKDILADGLGAIAAIMIFYGIHFREISCLTDPAA
jgi:putative membrane protein